MLAGALASQSLHAAGVDSLKSLYAGHAHHNTEGDSENIQLNWTDVTPHGGGKFSATLQIQAAPIPTCGAAPLIKIPLTEVPINGKVTAAGKVTFSGKVSTGSDSLTIKNGKGQLSALGRWILGTVTVQNKSFNETVSGKYTFELNASSV
jgi:hypothetical protein